MLWKKVMPRLSAGRVQSVATRLVVERERERIAFRSAPYWDLRPTFAPRRRGDRGATAARFGARLWSRWTAAGSPRAATSTRSASSRQGPKQVLHLDERGRAGRWPARLPTRLRGPPVESKPYRRSPYAPFRTTTLQQEASRKLGFGAKRTM